MSSMRQRELIKNYREYLSILYNIQGERITALQGARSTSCPYCGAKIGQNCNKRKALQIHQDRIMSILKCVD